MTEKIGKKRKKTKHKIYRKIVTQKKPKGITVYPMKIAFKL